MVQAAADALKDGRNQYPPMPGVPELRQAVAAANRRFYGLDIDWATEVTVTSGATEAITACLMAVLDPGDEVVLIEPLYDTYVPVVRDAGRGAAHRAADAAALGSAARGTGGGVRAEDQGDPVQLADEPVRQGVHRRRNWRSSPDLVERHDTYAICDEVYEHLTFDGARHIPLMTLPGMRDRTMRIGSAGKTFSLTGWKVGYVTGGGGADAAGAEGPPEPDIHHRAEPAACGRDRAWQRTTRISRPWPANLQARRDQLRRGIGLGRACRSCRRSGTYFITTDFAPLGFNGDDVAFCRHITEQAGVTAIPVSAFYDESGAPAALRPFRVLQAARSAGRRRSSA